MISPLDAERRKSEVSARELAYALHQSKSNVEKLEYLEKLLVQDPLFNHDTLNYLTRGEQYKQATQMAGRAEIIARRNNLSEEDTALLHVVLQTFTSCPSSTALHTGMFIKNLGLLFTDEQQKKWMDMAKQWRMVGCYAQTELGHGSNVRGLETTATYIPATDEFEIHSPTLTSMKWWPGALARTANFGVVYARLLLHGKDYGVHNFMVQLRDLETHDPMRGVTLGDIGPKIGFNNVDNGYCKFHQVRIPREQMGMRVSIVTRDGKYVKTAGVPKEILYFTMLQTRMTYVRSSGLALGKACTISIRYSAVRKQGYDANNPKSKEELSVLDYQTQQYRLFPLLAAAYAIVLTGNQVDSFSLVLADQIKHGDLTEGENFVLCQQTARALLKVHDQFRSGVILPEEMQFMANVGKSRYTQPRGKQQWLELDTYVEVFQQRFLHLLSGLVSKIASEPLIAAGIQNNSMLCYKLANAYTYVVLVNNFVAAVRSSTMLLPVLQLLCQLFVLTQLEANAGEFMESGCVFPNEMPLIRANIEELLVLIRPHAVTLVDGFNFSDHLLNSTLGRYDGNVYEALYESAQHDPLNHSSDKVALHELLRPIRDEISKSKSRL
ncbi:hypothetical protein BBJ29_010022, partial [Phytophthora kernoviae]|uniref:Acyl-coenzyme A oxidase n=1 Tax=Phytophthora kernoviae TaxID=325452 RepID=A0A3F2S3Z3_9STRA